MGRALDFLKQPSSGLVYQTLFFSEHVKFQYPPAGLLILDLLRWIGIRTPEELNFINAGLLIATGLVFAVFSVRVLGSIRIFKVAVPIGPIAFILALRFYPSNLAFQIGQMQILLGFLFLLACWAVLNDRRVLAGALIALAATVKPQFLPLGVLALWQRNWRFAAGMIGVTAASLALSISLYGWLTHLDYLSVLSFLSKHGEYQHLNQSLGGFLVRELYQGPSLDRDPSGSIPQSAFPPYIAAVYIPTIISSLLMLLTPFLVRSKGTDRISRLLEFCTASLLFTMASPIAWVHHYNILLPVYIVALKGVFERWQGARARIALTLLGVSLLLTGYPWALASDPTIPSLDLLQSHVFFGALMLVGILLIEMRAPLLRVEPGKSSARVTSGVSGLSTGSMGHS
ncbi:glycosyltransferase family 87 protein [Labrys okinawensis]|uniref:glycosyltransferase family 87 protein n=1 Tax=Labrys okinawensis TaxID=346911 RepID=UPI0039BD5D97